MTWNPPVRTATAQQMYASAEKDRAERPDRYRFDASMVVERATKHGRYSTDDFSEGWQDGLEAFLRSAEEQGRLNALGTHMALQMAQQRLSAGSRIKRYLREHPEIRDIELERPIVIIGGWRTGTTFLFRLLGTDRRLHAPLPGELTAPWRFAGPQPELPPAAGGANPLHTLNPDMKYIHPSGPDLPEECVLAMGTDLRNWGFTSMIRLPAYAAFLAAQHFGRPYARYREALQLIASGAGRRFVLKAPAELNHLVHALPGAVIVQIHRDIVETLTSGASLFAVYRSTYSDDVDLIDVGRQQADQTELWMRRAAAFRESAAGRSTTFVDLQYADLVQNTAACLEQIYAAADMEPPSPLEEFIGSYHRAHPRDAHGRHRYAPEDFGYTEGALRERFAFLSGP